MRKQHSWTRQDYELAYGLYRSYGEIYEEHWAETIPQEIIRAADYSYQGKDYQVHGWVSDARRKRFYLILWRVLAQTEGILF